MSAPRFLHVNHVWLTGQSCHGIHLPKLSPTDYLQTLTQLEQEAVTRVAQHCILSRPVFKSSFIKVTPTYVFDETTVKTRGSKFLHFIPPSESWTRKCFCFCLLNTFSETSLLCREMILLKNLPLLIPPFLSQESVLNLSYTI